MVGAREEHRWEEPTRAGTGSPVLDASQVAAWRERGFVLVDGVVPSERLEALAAHADTVFPAAGSPESERLNDFGSSGRMTFPAECDALNQITLDPRLLAVVSQLLDASVREIRLTQSDLWPKYGRQERLGGDRDHDDQRIHMDYPNHSLTHPPAWETPEAVEAILYLDDVDACGGATAVVPRTGPDDPAYAWPRVRTPGVAGLPWINDRQRAEAHLAEVAPEVAAFRAEHLYPREVRARYRPGTLLLYRHDTWHRGTPLRTGARRLALNLTYRLAEAGWVSVLHPGWAWAMYRRSGVMERLIAEATVDQRCVLGFPAPGHPYWTPETLCAVEARFGAYGFDVAPYRDAPPEPAPGARLALRPNCERCDVDLPPESDAVYICSFECTFCGRCTEQLGATCPNCGGELVRRPVRPAPALERFPASTQRVVKRP